MVKRKPRKITPLNLLAAHLEESLRDSPSYNDLAANIHANDGKAPSRQAVAQRSDKEFEDFLQEILSKVMALKIQQARGAPNILTQKFRQYKRVLVQDSTVIKLPSALFPLFSGVSNSTTSVCNARVQAVYDLISGKLIAFSIDPYSKNDLKAAPELEIQSGDLVLRDRGYLTAAELRRHVDSHAHFIYRHKTGVAYLDPKTKLPLDLPALLKRRGNLDMEVLTNDGQKTLVRLLAAPVDAETAALRRMRAKKETKGHNPSEAVLELMDWTIFITNIPGDKAGFAEILDIYGLRWRIEVIFKAWKGHLNFDAIHRVSSRQLQILLKTRLLVIAAASNCFRKFEALLWRNHGKRLSLLKFMNYLAADLNRLKQVFFAAAEDTGQPSAVGKALARYCCYDKRKQRQNFAEMWAALA